MGFKRFLESSRFLRSIRFGWETEPTGPGGEDSIENGELNDPIFLEITVKWVYNYRRGWSCTMIHELNSDKRLL